MTTIGITGFNVLDTTNFVGETRLGTGSRPDPKLRIQNDSVFSSVLDDLSHFQTLVEKLSSRSAFEGTRATSSQGDVVSTSSVSGAKNGKHDVEVQQVAKRQITTSTTGFALTTDTVADGGSISFTVDGATTAAINVSSATTLSGLRTLINDQNSGVVASIANDGSQNYLVVTSRRTGSGAGFTVSNSLTNSGGTAVAFDPDQSLGSGNTQNARSALFKVDGIEFDSQTNTVVDAIGGASLTLLKKGTTSIEISADHSGLGKSIRGLRDTFNRLDESTRRLSRTDSGASSSDLIVLGSRLRDSLGEARGSLSDASNSSGKFKTLAEVGLTFDRSGRLELDESRLTSALAASAGDVERLFRGDSAGRAGAFTRLKVSLDGKQGIRGLILPKERTSRTSKDEVSPQASRLKLQEQHLVRLAKTVASGLTGLKLSNSMLGSLSLRARIV